MLAALLLVLQDSVRTEQRMELQRDVARTNGVWKLHEWGHYFVLTDIVDPALFEQLERRVFEARMSLVRLFPEAESDPVRDDRKLPVLRVTKNLGEYQSYGGPGGSTGYWSAVTNELVIYEDTDRRVTWEAVAGCVASEFVDEFFGNAPRADWFELGLSECCCSVVRARELPAESLPTWPRLDEILSARRGFSTEARLAGWSLMRFLVDEEFQGPDFDARWAKIPERYAVGWVAQRDEAKARAFALEGLDLAVLERAWRASLSVK